MKRAFGAALSAALVAGLALAALSGGATTRTSVATLDDGVARVVARAGTITYKGKFRNAGPDTSIKIKARGQGGEPTAIKAMSYKMLPANCPVSKPHDTTIDGGWTLAGITVNDERRFKARGNDGRPHPSSLNFTGRFSRNFNKVRGRFQTNSYFGPDTPPAETCVSKTKRYRAKR